MAAMKLGNHQAILVTGAGGFIGKDVVARLLKRGWPVKAMVRKTSAAAFPPHERLQVVVANMKDADSLRAAMNSVAVVVHLAAAKSDEKDSEDVNVGGARRLVAACQAAGCKRVINISTMAVKIPRKGAYARTKNEADKVFQSSGLEVTTLLPNVVYGEDRGGVFGTVLNFIQKLPLVPVLGNGRWILAPVYIGDVSEAIISCIETDITKGRVYDIAGPDQMAFDDFIDRLGSAVNVSRPKLHIPFSIALTAARVATALLSHPPITVSNVLGSNQNVPIDNEPARRDFGFDPLDFDTGLNAAMGKIPNPRALNA